MRQRLDDITMYINIGVWISSSEILLSSFFIHWVQVARKYHDVYIGGISSIVEPHVFFWSSVFPRIFR